MDYEWDEAKRRRNIAEHGVDFIDAALIFEGPILEAPDRRRRHGEVRHRALGRVDDDVVVYTWRGGRRRIISAWKVGPDGEKRYQTVLRGSAQAAARKGRVEDEN